MTEDEIRDLLPAGSINRRPFHRQCHLLQGAW
jgi:hypothetical protein